MLAALSRERIKEPALLDQTRPGRTTAQPISSAAASTSSFARPAAGECAECRNIDDALHAIVQRGAQKRDAPLDIGGVNFIPVLRSKIVRAMDKGIDALPGQISNISPELEIDALRVRNIAAPKGHHLPTVAAKAANEC